MTRYIVDLKELQDGKVSLDGTFGPGDLDFTSEGLTQSAPLVWNLAAERAGEEVRITGGLKATFALTCSRCLEPAQVDTGRSFELYFRQRDETLFDEDDEIELSDEDTQTAFFAGTELQIGDILREQVLLALPMKALCAIDCKGLCPACGTNLNLNTCACPGENFTPHMGQLRDIKRKLEQRSL